MNCTYCGAKYHKNAERCPFCNSENPKMVERRKAKIKEDLDIEARKLAKELPGKKVKKAHKIEIIILVVVLGLLLVGTVVGVIGSKVAASVEYAVYERNTEKLETFFQAEEWDELYEYMQDNDLWDSMYEKYGQIYDVGYHCRESMELYYEFYLDSMEKARLAEDEEFANLCVEQGYKYLEYALENASCLLKETQKYVNDRVILGNEKVLKAWHEETIEFLIHEVGLTEEDIELLKKCDDEEILAALMEKYYEKDR